LEDFDGLYRASYQRIFGSLVVLTGNPTTAEDCAQETFLKAFNGWAKRKPEVPVEAWLHRIAINTAISHRRSERLREVGEVVRRLGRPQPMSTDTDLGTDLLRELRRLPPKQAAAIVLRHVHGYSNREIAFALGVPESTVATRLADGRRILRSRLRVYMPVVVRLPH
jgi:RNA polymerase sigma factor (sigma-70 family)